MSDSVTEARAWLEAKEEGAFGAMCEHVLVRRGVLHMGPECVLAGYACDDDAGCFHIVFANGDLPLVYRVLSALGYERLEWRRAYGHGERYGVRRRALAEWGRKYGLAERLSRKEDL